MDKITTLDLSLSLTKTALIAEDTVNNAPVGVLSMGSANQSRTAEIMRSTPQ